MAAAKEHPHLPLQGIRVVELSNFFAAPACCKVLSDLGAEVVKVEDPEGGDTLRKFMLEAMPGRKWSTFFDCINMNKPSVALNLRTERGVQDLLTMVRGADVFVTNIRTAGLERLGLDYHKLSCENPSLVYAHLTAWGLEGPEANLPGYDIGSFWAMTGMAAATSASPNQAGIPIGFGDSPTGAGLAAGIIAALAQRHRTGWGRTVMTSLFRSGIWGAAGMLLGADGKPVAEEDDDAVPTYPESPGVGPDARSRTYTTKDKYRVAITTTGQREAGGDDALALRLCDALFTAASGSYKGKAPLADTIRPGDGARVEQRVREMTLGELREALTAQRVPHVVLHGYRTLADAIPDPEGNARHLFTSGVLVPSKDVIPDIPYVVRTPYDIAGAPTPGGAPFKRAQPVGADTSTYIDGPNDNHWPGKRQNKWPTSPDKEIPLGMPLEGLTVVELGDPDEPSCALGCRQLADAGAKVIRIVTPADDAVARRSSARWNVHLAAGKEVRACADLPAAAALASELIGGGADMLVTNLPENELAELGVDAAALRALQPSCVHLLITPWGAGCPGPRGELAAFWAGSGIPLHFARCPDPPKYFGAAMAAMHIACLGTAALLRRLRFKAGASCHLSLLGCGMWSAMQMLALGQADANAARLVRNPTGYVRSDFQLISPAVTTGAHRTKDGMHVQLLGAELRRHFGVTFDAVGKRRQAIARAAAVATFRVLPNVLLAKSPLGDGDWKRRALPLFRTLNGVLADEIGKRTWAELQAEFKQRGVWHCRVRSPGQVLRSKQALLNGCFPRDPDGTLIIAAPPKFFTRSDVLKMTGAAKRKAEAKAKL